MTGLVELELVIRDDGTLCGAYLKLRDGKAARTEVVEPDTVLADYDAEDWLLGVDVLAPTDASVVVDLVDDPRQKDTVKTFMRKKLGDLLTAA